MFNNDLESFPKIHLKYTTLEVQDYSSFAININNEFEPNSIPIAIFPKSYEYGFFNYIINENHIGARIYTTSNPDISEFSWVEKGIKIEVAILYYH